MPVFIKINKIITITSIIVGVFSKNFKNNKIELKFSTNGFE